MKLNTYNILFLCHMCHETTERAGARKKRKLLCHEVCHATKPKNKAMVIGNVKVMMHMVKLAPTELKNCELRVPIYGGSDVLCQLLKETFVWWPMDIAIGMCALHQHRRTNPECMFVPAAKTRKRVERFPPSVKKVLTLVCKRNGCACIEIPVEGKGIVLVHDVSMCDVSDHVRQTKHDEWKTVVDTYTRACVLWDSRDPVPFEFSQCERAKGYGQMHTPVHSVSVVRRLLLGSIRPPGFPLPSPKDLRNEVVCEFSHLWNELEHDRKFVMCHNDRGLEGGLHTSEHAKNEDPTLMLLPKDNDSNHRSIDDNLIFRMSGYSDIMKATGVSSTMQRSVVHKAAKGQQKRRFRKKVARHEAKLQGFHKMEFSGPFADLCEGGQLTRDATYCFGCRHHKPALPSVGKKRKSHGLVVGDELEDVGAMDDIDINKGLHASHAHEGKEVDLFWLVPRDNKEIANTLGQSGSLQPVYDAFQELENHTDKDDCRVKSTGTRVAGKDGHSHYTNVGTTTLICGRGMTHKMGGFSKPLLRMAFSQFSSWVKRIDHMCAKWMPPDSMILFDAVKKFCEQQGLRLCDGNEALFPAMVVQKNPFLNCHTDPDFNYALVTIVSREVPGAGISDDVVCYFCFPTLGVAVPLRSGDMLFFNPKIPHCVSARIDPTKDSFCVSFYMNKNYPSGRDERQVLTEDEVKGSASVKNLIVNSK